MTETKRQLTPCLVSRNQIAGLRTGTVNQAIAMHSRTDPCGLLDQGDGNTQLPTFVEWMEDTLRDRQITLKRCRYCGSDL